ncbi:hypothetical protein [Baaleninema simplex]|nr:hypothetical protein [Baaleninema simplex]
MKKLDRFCGLSFGDRYFNLDENDSVDRESGIVGEWGLGDRSAIGGG